MPKQLFNKCDKVIFKSLTIKQSKEPDHAAGKSVYVTRIIFNGEPIDLDGRKLPDRHGDGGPSKPIYKRIIGTPSTDPIRLSQIRPQLIAIGQIMNELESQADIDFTEGV